jgi:hypothetical protein
VSITNYGELKTAVANWLERDDLTARIPEFIAMAEDMIAKDVRIRIRAMETSTDLTVSSQTVALPTGFIGARRLYLDGTPKKRVEFVPPEEFWIRNLASQTSQPKYFTIEGDNLVFGPSPDATYTGKLLYYQRLTAFSDDSDTNSLLTEARGIYLFASLLESAPYLVDDARLAIWAVRYDDLAEKIHKADKRDRYTGAPLVARSDVQVDTRQQR